MRNLSCSSLRGPVLGLVFAFVWTLSGWAGLAHRYSFSEGSGVAVADSVGGANAVLVNTNAVTMFLGTGAVQLNGTNGYVDLPNGIISSKTNATFEAWVTWKGGVNWARIFDFGTSTGGENVSGTGAAYTYLTLRSGNSGNPAVWGIRRADQNYDSAQISIPTVASNTPVHVAVTFDWSQRLARLFLNGQPAGYTAMTQPLSTLTDNNNWLGRSQYNDPYYAGTFTEFRIYDTALSAVQLAADTAAGPDVVPADPGNPTAVRLVITNASAFPNVVSSWRTQQVAVVADYAAQASINVTVGEGVVYTSSDTNVFTVDSLGFVRAFNPGAATLTVSYRGLVDSKVVTIAPQDGAMLTHRYSFSEASGTTVLDLVGSAHGMITNPYSPGGVVTNYQIGGGKLTLVQAGTNAAYVALPAGTISAMTNATFEGWVVMSNAPGWQRLFDFGGSGNNYIFFAGQNPYRLAFKYSAAAGENPVITGPGAFPLNTLTHVVCTYNAAAGLAKVFVNGVLMKSGPTVYPMRGMADANCYLGRSQFPDPYWKGDYTEFRIYEGSMSEGDVALSYAAGPDALPGTSAGAVQSISLQLAAVMSGSIGSQQSVLTANFQNAPGIYIGQNMEVTYWSSDPSVVSVTSAGVVTAVRPGSATITAIYHGMKDSKRVTVLPSAQTLAHRWSFNEASGTTVLDSVAGAAGNGTVLGTNFSRAGGQLSINTAGADATTYVDLPNGLVSGLSNITVEGWATWTDVATAWQRIFDFGASAEGEGNSGTGTSSFFLSPKINSATGLMRVNLNSPAGSALVDWTGKAFPTNTLTHFAVVYARGSNALYGYINGARVMTVACSIPLSSLTDFNNWLGRSQFNDPYFKGSFNEFRIYSGALLDWEVRNSFLQGQDVAIQPPAMVNQPVKAVTPVAAYPAGGLNLTSLTNAAGAQVRLCWGGSDAGATTEGWGGVVDLGVMSAGPVWTKISGLAPGTTYYYRYYASNGLGESWADAAQSFTTPALFNDAGYTYVMTNTFTGYTNAETLVNFPVLVVLNTSLPGFSYDQLVSPGNADLRFVEARGGELNYEIESWNPNGSSFVWVQLPELNPATTAIRVYWGKPGVSVPAYSTNGATWNDGFAGVWHMTNKVVSDSSRHGYDATNVLAPAAIQDTEGKIGPGLDCVTALGNPAIYVGGINFTNATLSAWVWCRDANRQGLFMCKDSPAAYSGGDLYFWQQGANLRFETFNWGGDTVVALANSGGMASWIHFAVVVNGHNQALYTNGVMVASWTKLGPGVNADPFQLVGSVKGGRYHNGRIDECRAEWVGRSASWIRACYQNQSAPQQFSSFSPIKVIPYPLAVANPRVISAGMTDAVLGARVASDNANGVTLWGVAWGLAPSPAANTASVAGAAAAPFNFTVPVSGLVHTTHYYFRGFASNSVEGLVYSIDGEFDTPAEPPSGLVFSDVKNNSLAVSWTPSLSGPGSVVLVRQGAPVSVAPQNGVTYTGYADFGLGPDLGGGTYVVYAGAGNTVALNNLLRNTACYVSVFSYYGDGARRIYQAALPLTGSQVTANRNIFDVAGRILIDLHYSRGLVTNDIGSAVQWVNYGAAGGSFQVDGLDTTYPVADVVNGQECVSFDGADHLKASFAAPEEITGLNVLGQPDDYTIESWIYNPSIASEEWIFSWAQRGTLGRCAAFGYGTNSAFGALGHWGAADVPYAGGVPAAGVWHHVVATYDGVNNRIYVDGVLNTAKANTLNLWDGGPCTLGDQYTTASPLAYANIPYSGSLAALRVHSRCLAASQVASNYLFGPAVAPELGSVQYTVQPASLTVCEEAVPVLSVSARGDLPLSYQWFTNGALLPGATASTLILPPAGILDDGMQILCVASNFSAGIPALATSVVATLTVVRAAPALTHRWTFDTDASDAVGGAHGELVNGAVIRDGAVVLDGTNQYVNLPNDLFTNHTSASFEAWVADDGTAGWGRIWDFGNSALGEDFVPGTAGASGTRYMFASSPSGTATLRGAYTVSGSGAGEQIMEWPGRSLPVGQLSHVVWTTDGQAGKGALYVNGVLVASNTALSLKPSDLGPTQNDWLGRSQFNDPFFRGRIAEFRTYNLALSAAKVSQVFEMGPAQPLSDGPVYVYKQPAAVTAGEFDTAAFIAGVNGRTPVSVQWFKNGAPIPGATSLALSFEARMADNNATLVMWATNWVEGVAQTASSAPVVLTVLPDTNAPAILRVNNQGLAAVEVRYSEVMDAASATNLARYRLEGPAGAVAASSAVLDAAGVTVTLAVDPLVVGSNYVLTVANVTDRAATPNPISPNPSVVGFQATPYFISDVGSPVLPGSIQGLPGGYAFSADGGGIGGARDQFTFAYERRSGDFDVQARVAGLSLANMWSKAGLMARESLDAPSRFAAAFTTPGQAGEFFEYRLSAGRPSVMLGNFPANYPFTWTRLKRAGNQFSGYASLDGVTWTLLGTAALTLPSDLYVGLAASSGASGQATTAQFRDVGATVSPVEGLAGSDLEPLGPSSRRTGLAISEIMYRPAPRTDGLSAEFVEIYNSNPFFHDMSGYRLAGDVDFVFPQGTIIPANGFVVVASRPADVQTLYGVSGVYGPYTNTLKTAGTVRLRDEQNTILLEVVYQNTRPWPMGADGTGHSIVLARPSYGEADPRAWAISDVAGGSPGAREAFRASPLRNVVINEILANAGPDPAQDYVELYNHSSQSVDVSGCVLTDNPSTNRFVIPAATVIPARGFVAFTQTQLGFGLKGNGDTIYLRSPDGSRVLDAQRFDAQGQGLAFGRYPDGAAEFYALSAQTPGTANTGYLNSDVVINEIMFNPISKNDDDQFVELYNKGAAPVSLGGWSFVQGITYTIPPGVVLAPDSYLVVARNRTNLLAKYPALNNANTVGDFGGSLAHGGERLALAMPEYNITTNAHGAPVTNSIQIVVEEMTYSDGGRWGQWADGGGSSLELTDARANRRLASSWADSDESAKSSWTTIQYTGVLDNGSNYSGAAITFAQLGPLDPGECLVDDIEVVPAGGANIMANPNFEAGLANWALQGALSRSALETGGGYGAGNALRLRTGNRVFTVANSAQGNLSVTTLAEGQTATLRFKARWLKGCPEVLMRLGGNWLDVVGTMPVPANLGTPGARNSRAVANAGPAIAGVVHNPPLPASGQPVLVTASVQDPDGVASVTLRYRIEPAAAYTTFAMLDDGTGGDAVAGDGVYTATLPGQPAAGAAAFTVTASDTRAAASVFPALLNNNGPERECVVRWGEPNPASTFGTYHLWTSLSNQTRWATLPMLSNEDIDGTLVYNNRVVYNMFTRYAGSPYHQIFYSPTNGPAHMTWEVPSDEKLLGSSSFNKIHWIGNDIQDDTVTSNNNDSTLQREQAANTLLRGLGQPWVYRRFVAVYVNGVRRGQLMEDALRPSVSVPDAYFPGDTGGFLYKVQPWFEGGPAAAANTSWPWQNSSWAFLMPYTSADGYKLARYRWCYEPRQSPDRLSNYTNLMTLVTAGTNWADPNWTAIMENVADMENWMRLVAANHAAGNWDCWGIQNGQNIYAYVSPQVRWSLYMFDFSIVMGNRIAWAPGANLEAIPALDTTWQHIYSATGNPAFRRMYWRALKELANGALRSSEADALIDAKYAAFLANNITATSPDALKSWISQARASIQTQVAARDTAGFSLAASEVAAAANAAVITGAAPLDAVSILVDGVAYPVTWTGIGTWSVRVPAGPGVVLRQISALDRKGQAVGAAQPVIVNNAGTPADPAGAVVFSEIMVSPLNPDAQFVELFNNSATTTFDLSGWKINGLGYTFPAGSALAPNAFLVLARSRIVYAAVYGPGYPVFGEFTGALQADGETLTLLRPDVAPAPDIVVDRVRYEAVAPWPWAAGSLQVIDTTQDNSRASNWAVDPVAFATPGRSNSVAAAVAPYPTLWVNEVQPLNPGAHADAAGHYGPWVELYNNGSVSVPLDGLYLASSYAGLGQWAFPAGVVIPAGQFLVVWLDGDTAESTATELHAGFRLSAANGSIILSRSAGASVQVVDYLNYATVAANSSYGSVPDGQPFYRQLMHYSTPGATNNGAIPPVVAYINEWMASNTRTLPNPVGGKYDDWFELYNPGAQPVSLDGCYLGTDLADPFQFAVPAGYSIPAGGYLVVWADGKPGRNSTNEPSLHTSFQLSKGGEAIGFFAPGGVLIDGVTFGPQTNDISEGRYADGVGPRFFMTTPTPGRANIAPPTPAEIQAVTLVDQPLVLGAGKIAAFSKAPGGPADTVTTVSAASTNGGTVTLVNHVVTYTPVAGFTGTDRFSYTVSGPGGVGSSYVAVTVKPGNLASLNVVFGPVYTGGVFRVGFAGLPNHAYRVETAPTVLGPWTTLTTVTAPRNGQFVIEDPAPPSAPQRFYRTVAE